MLRGLSTHRTTYVSACDLPRPGLAAALVVVLLASASAATAQPGRVFVEVNGGVQISTTDFSDNVVFTEFVEEGDLNATYAIDTGPTIDVGGGVVLGKGVALGAGYTRFDRNQDAPVDARVPHPFFFEQPRSISGNARNLTRLEEAVHLQLRWFLPVPGPVQLAVFGEPSFVVLGRSGSRLGRHLHPQLPVRHRHLQWRRDPSAVGIGDRLPRRRGRCGLLLAICRGGWIRAVLASHGRTHLTRRWAVRRGRRRTASRSRTTSALLVANSPLPRCPTRHRTAWCGRGLGRPSAAGFPGLAPPCLRTTRRRSWSRARAS